MFRTSYRRVGSRKGRYAFTLVELLVVVAIIALLISILLPTLNKAKEQARSVVCKTNLKNITLVTMMYSFDYNGWVRAAAGRGARVGGRWDETMQLLGFLPEVDESNTLSFCPDLVTLKTTWVGCYSYGQRSARAFYTGASASYGWFNMKRGQVLCRQLFYSTSTGALITETGDFYPYVPAEFILHADSIIAASGYLDTGKQCYAFFDDTEDGYNPGSCIEMRHSGKANCGFADSHVESIGRTELNNLGFNDNCLWPPAP